MQDIDMKSALFSSSAGLIMSLGLTILSQDDMKVL